MGVHEAASKEGAVIILLTIITFAFCLKGLLAYLAKAYIAKLRAEMFLSIRSEVADSFSKISMTHYHSKTPGYFTNIATNQSSHAVDCFSQLMMLISQLAVCSAYILFAIGVNWEFTVLALVMGGVGLSQFRRLNAHLKYLSYRTADANSELYANLVQFIQAHKYLLATARADSFLPLLNNNLVQLSDFEKQRGIAEALTASVREPIAVVALTLLLAFQVLYLDQNIQSIFVAALLFYRTFTNLIGLQSARQGFVNRYGGFLAVERALIDMGENMESKGTGVAKFPDGLKLELQNVCFSYKGSASTVLDRVNIELKSNQMVALVGASGAGKTTIVDLMMGLLIPTSGRVIFQGVGMQELCLKDLRSQIGYVSQDVVIFDSSIRENLSLGEALPEERLWDALDDAHLKKFVESLPLGLDELVGDRGCNLSGGQRQRLFMARELLRKPRLLILDEATSALDSESELAIKQTLDSLKSEMTVVVIAHRLSTIKEADCVYVLDNGTVAEHGSYLELCKKEGSKLNDLVEMQKL